MKRKGWCRCHSVKAVLPMRISLLIHANPEIPLCGRHINEEINMAQRGSIPWAQRRPTTTCSNIDACILW